MYMNTNKFDNIVCFKKKQNTANFDVHYYIIIEFFNVKGMVTQVKTSLSLYLCKLDTIYLVTHLETSIYQNALAHLHKLRIHCLHQRSIVLNQGTT